jgi:DNA-binding IclR family transcriptional regulator
VVLRQENPGPTGFSVRLGATIDLFNSCSGNVLLAFTDSERLHALLGSSGEESRRTLAKVEPVLAGIRERGHERRASPMTHGVEDVSYPVFGFDGRLIAALTIPFLERTDGSQPVAIDDSRAMLAEAAGAISAGLGWYGNNGPA